MAVLIASIVAGMATSLIGVGGPLWMQTTVPVVATISYSLLVLLIMLDVIRGPIDAFIDPWVSVTPSSVAATRLCGWLVAETDARRSARSDKYSVSGSTTYDAADAPQRYATVAPCGQLYDDSAKMSPALSVGIGAGATAPTLVPPAGASSSADFVGASGRRKSESIESPPSYSRFFGTRIAPSVHRSSRQFDLRCS